MLVDKSEYLTAGIHIGMKSCTPYAKQFVYKIRDDGLAVFNLQKVDERIKIAADFLSRFESILAVSRKEAGIKPAQAFASVVGGKAIAESGRLQELRGLYRHRVGDPLPFMARLVSRRLFRKRAR